MKQGAASQQVRRFQTFGRDRPSTVRVEAPEMKHAPPRRGVRAPRLPPQVRQLVALGSWPPGVREGDDASAALGVNPFGHPRPDSAAICENQPVPGQTRRPRCQLPRPVLPGGPRKEQRLRGERVSVLLHLRQGDRLREPRGREQLEPLLARKQGMRRPQVLVGKPPPSLGHPEGDVEPPQGARGLHDGEDAPRDEQPLEVPQRVAQAAGRVKHVDGEDQVELLKRDPLRLGIALDVQELVADERVGLEPLRGSLGEGRGYVGEHVLAPVRRQDGQDRGRGSPRARAHFQQLQHAPLRRPRDGRGDGLLHEAVEGARSRRILVEPLGGRHGSAREQQRQRIGISAQHLRQPPAAASRHAHLAGGRGMALHQLGAACLGVDR